MNESTFRGVAIKSIAIIGFFATIVLVVWLAVEGVKRAPGAFASLASIAESISNYPKTQELTLSTEKSVMNSNESFQISWTDMKRDGEYHFTYTCTSGVDLLVRDGDGKLVPMGCTDTLSLPSTVHGLFLSATSDDARFIDIPLSVSFTDKNSEVVLKGETKITVVNPAILPALVQNSEIVTSTTTPKVEEKPAPVVATPIIKPETATVTPKVKTVPHAIAKPVFRAVYPQSDPNGVVDLRTTTIGSGVLTNGVFAFTAKYDRNLENAIKFDIRNIGSKTSEVWTFKTIFPNGTTYESDPQLGLKPNEHVEFTLGFSITDDTKDNFVKITNTAYTSSDVNTANNSAAWFVAVQG